MTADGKWMTLIDAVRETVRQMNDDNRLPDFIAYEWWERYSDPSARRGSPEEIQLFKRAVKASKSATSTLTKLLRQTLISGQGIHGADTEPSPITKSEWGTHDFNFWGNALRPCQGRTGSAIREIAIDPKDHRREVAKAIEADLPMAKTERRNDSVAASQRPRGRRPVQMPRVIAAMRADLANRYDLIGATEEELKVRYSASREVCRNARKVVLSEIVED
jgi:hypothetical protein